MTEADVSSKLRVELVAGGSVAYKVSDRFHASRPDLIICYKGSFIAIETKMHPGIPTDLQTLTLTELVTNGAQAYVATYDKRTKRLTMLELNTGHATQFPKIKDAAIWVLKQSSLRTSKQGSNA